MAAEQSVQGHAQLTARNVGGIDETSVTFEPGVTVLEGRNATNRTSLLQAIMAGLGSDRVSIKGDADEAVVELAIAGETYERVLRRRDGAVVSEGEAYLDDPTLADLFAFLLESNDARRAVTTGGDLRETLMQPLDTDEIQAEIQDRLDERRELDEELEELDRLRDRLPTLTEKRTRLRDEVDDLESDLAAAEERLESRDVDVEQTREEQAELEEKLGELREKRATLEDVRYELETEKDSLESLQAEKRDLAESVDEIPESPSEELAELDSRIERLREQKQDLETSLNELQSVIQFNQERLDESDDEFVELSDDGDAGEVTDELLADDATTCWTCGTEVAVEQIEETLERLRELSQAKLGEINDRKDRISELKAEREELRDNERERERAERRLAELDDEIEAAERRIEDLTDRRDARREEIREIEDAVEDMEDEAYEEILDLHRDANELEYELGTTESELERVEEEIASIETRLDEEPRLESERAALDEEIESLRTRIERIEADAIENFNEHMETILDLLEYENIERIWIERLERSANGGRGSGSERTFELHVVRKTDSGTAYEDEIGNLSESEREVTGLVFALAGYLAHEVYESVPFVLLDSMEAIDSARIASIVEYFDDYSDYLVIALLPEDAQALSTDYRRVTEI